MDFTLDMYTNLLTCLKDAGFSFQTYRDFIRNPVSKVVIFRHDVDRSPFNSLKVAQIENGMGIKGSYYFRIVKGSYNEGIIKQIAGLNHEIGYHYESMDTCKGNIDKAFSEFCINLDRFRQIVQIDTICMHGSPLSKFDNRDIWKKYNYKVLDIIGEPYFDIDFSKVLYLTDTGRRWDGRKVSIRDKEERSSNSLLSEAFHFHSTFDIIQSIQNLPEQIMITTHPQRWSNNILLVLREFVSQNIKNVAKRIIVYSQS